MSRPNTRSEASSGDVAVFRDRGGLWVVMGFALLLIGLVVSGEGALVVGIPVVVYWGYALWARYVKVGDEEVVIRRFFQLTIFRIEDVRAVGERKLGFWRGDRCVVILDLAYGKPLEFPDGMFGYWRPPTWHKEAVAEIQSRLAKRGHTLDIPEQLRVRWTGD